jgi:hypothetical protein
VFESCTGESRRRDGWLAGSSTTRTCCCTVLARRMLCTCATEQVDGQRTRSAGLDGHVGSACEAVSSVEWTQADMRMNDMRPRSSSTPVPYIWTSYRGPRADNCHPSMLAQVRRCILLVTRSQPPRSRPRAYGAVHGRRIRHNAHSFCPQNACCTAWESKRSIAQRFSI